MTEKHAHEVVPFPREREIVIDAGRLGIRRHIMHGLAEVDVTDARRYIREHQARTGETLSFTAFIVACLAKAVGEYKYAHAYRSWRNQLVLFDQVDVVTMIETARDGVALPHIIRAANKKTFYEIHCEIRRVQTTPNTSAQKSALTRFAPYAPAFVRRLFYWAVRSNPRWMKEIMGTVVVTAVGMFGEGGFWGLSFLPMHTLGVTVGGIAPRAAFVAGQVKLREMVNLTISFDHDILDGAAATRFARRFKELIENSYGLDAIGS